MTQVNFPQCTTIGDAAFANCTNLSQISFPECTSIGYQAFIYCYSLTQVSFPKCTNISAFAFYGCSRLLSLYFLGNSIITLSSSNAFINTPLTDNSYTELFGNIYVPATLLATYKTATNWVYYSSRIVGI